MSSLAHIVARARETGRSVRGPLSLDTQPTPGAASTALEGMNGEILKLVQA